MRRQARRRPGSSDVGSADLNASQVSVRCRYWEGVMTSEALSLLCCALNASVSALGASESIYKYIQTHTHCLSLSLSHMISPIRQNYTRQAIIKKCLAPVDLRVGFGPAMLELPGIADVHPNPPPSNLDMPPNTRLA